MLNIKSIERADEQKPADIKSARQSSLWILVVVVFCLTAVSTTAQIVDGKNRAAKLPASPLQLKRISREVENERFADFGRRDFDGGNSSIDSLTHRAANSTNVDNSFNGSLTDGYTRVEAVAVQPDGKMLFGGNFPLVNGVRRDFLARLNPDGSLDTSFNAGNAGVSGSIINSIRIQPDGKILIAGSFTSYNGFSRNSVARLNSDGSLDATFNPGLGAIGSVQDILLLSDGKIVISGFFAQYNGTTISCIARLNSDGSLDTSFTPPSFNSTIYQAASLPDGKIIVAGFFTNVNGTTRSYAARLNANGSLDPSFAPGTGTLTSSYAVAVQADGKVLIRGSSTKLIRLNTDGTIDATFTPAALASDADSSIHQITILSDGKILVGGALGDGLGNLFGVVKFNANGSLDTSFTRQQNIEGGLEVFSIALTPDGKIVAGGDLYKLGSAASTNKRIARLNSDGMIDTSFGGSIEGFGYARTIVRQADGKIIVGGNFNAANGTPRKNIVRFNLDGSVDSSFNTSVNNEVVAIALQPDGKILIGGSSLTSVNNTVGLPGIARLNADGSLDTTFNASGFTGNLVLSVAAQSDGKVLLGGLIYINTRFEFYGIVRLNANGSIDNNFTLPTAATSFTSYTVNEISLAANSQIYVGGNFSNFAGSGRARIARLNANGTVDASFNTGAGANAAVNAVAQLPDGKVLIGGSFTAINGTNVNRIARLNANGTVDSTFNVGGGFDSTVADIALQPKGANDYSILIAGSFTNFGTTSRRYLARFDSNGALDNSFVSEINNSVSAVALQPDAKILIGGLFTSVDGQTHNAVARLDAGINNPKTAFDFDGDGKADVSVFRPSNGIWYLLNSASGFSGVQFGAPADKLAPADYDGDGKTDLAVYRTGVWYLQRSQLGFTGVSFGTAEDIPAPADFDGDGKADLAVFRPSSGTWYLQRSQLGFTGVQFGQSGDRPVTADYDGDGKADIAVNRGGIWYIQRSQLGFTGVEFGASSDKPVPADYDGDGRADVAVFRPSNGVWYLNRSQLGFTGIQFGIGTDAPAPADYDGDGKTDVAVFRDGTWYLNRSIQGFTGVSFGAMTDRPIPNSFVP